jgi:hypothetical protein
MQKIRDRISRLSPRQRIASATGTAVVVVAVVIIVATVVFASTPAAAKHNPHSKGGSSTTSSSSSTPTHPKLATDLCPLTGEKAPGGKVPLRPAIGIKIGNDPAARPQSGLPDADIVYEEMAEGGITRYLAIFQCHPAPVLGPVRSVRWDDWHILATYRHPILAYSGGIGLWESVAAGQSWLYNADGSYEPMANAYSRTTNRYAPENLYTSTKALWSLDSSMHLPPEPQFHYRWAAPNTATTAASVTIVGFSEGENVTWKWDPSIKAWQRYQGRLADTDASGQQLHANNVVVEMVQSRPEPCCETGDIPGVESVTEGSGVAYVFRNGKVEKGTWSAAAYKDIPQLRSANGNIMSLHPGNTWVELVPSPYPTSYAVQIQS